MKRQTKSNNTTHDNTGTCLRKTENVYLFLGLLSNVLIGTSKSKLAQQHFEIMFKI